MINIVGLKTNYLDSPSGITKSPQFTWLIQSTNRNVLQTAYRLQISQDETFDTILFDSQKVESSSSSHVSSNINLTTASTYYVRVKVWDNLAEESSYSPVSSFVTGIIDPQEWHGFFISAESKDDLHASKGTYLRKEIHTNKKIKKAIAYTTALGLYHFYINGQKVGTDELAPGWTSYNKRLLYQTHDVTSFLNGNTHCIAAHVGPGWYKGTMGFTHSRNIYGDQTAFFCQIHIEYEDGSVDELITDQTWECSDSPVVFSEIYDGEIYDARLEKEGWNKADFCSNGWHSPTAITMDFSLLVAQEGCKIKPMTLLPVKEIIETPQGDTVLDFGQNLTGWVKFSATGEAGDVVELNCFEVLDKEGNVYLDNLRAAKQTLHYTLKDNNSICYQPNFTFQGFRYVKVTSYPGEIKKANFIAYAVHSDMEVTGTFECSNPDINQLQHNILWGLKSNFVDVPTDCPQRDERLGWTGDAQIFCSTASYLVNTYTFFSKWLQDLAADQTPEGGVPHVIPDILTNRCDHDQFLSHGTHSAAAWGDAAIINPWTHYMTYGDSSIIHQQYDSMKAWIDFMTNHVGEDGTWSYKLQFGDWVALDAEEGSYFGATPNELICTAYYAYSTHLFTKMAKVINKQEDYAYYNTLYQDIVSVFQDKFFTADGNMTAQTQTAHIIALYFRLTPPQYIEKTTTRLVELLEKENGHLVTGFVGTPYFCHALSQNGRLEEAYGLLFKDDFPSWLFQVRMGATTIWEHWDGIKKDGSMWSADMNSFNHYAYGAIGDWLYRVVLGLQPVEDAPGYKHFLVYPRITNRLQFAKGTYQSPYGQIYINWQKTDDTVSLHVCVPANTTADIRLENVSQIVTNDGIIFSPENGDYIGHVGSGNYRITYTV